MLCARDEFTTRYFLFFPLCFRLNTQYSRPTTDNKLAGGRLQQAVPKKLQTARFLLLAAFCLLLTTLCMLSAVPCSLLTAICLLLTACCLLNFSYYTLSPMGVPYEVTGVGCFHCLRMTLPIAHGARWFQVCCFKLCCGGYFALLYRQLQWHDIYSSR